MKDIGCRSKNKPVLAACNAFLQKFVALYRQPGEPGVQVGIGSGPDVEVAVILAEPDVAGVAEIRVLPADVNNRVIAMRVTLGIDFTAQSPL